MHEILSQLPANSLVLDLGSCEGSFPQSATKALAVRTDLAVPAGNKSTCFVQADAARLPFADHVFSAVVSNHSLEHFADSTGALMEVRRVLARDGALFIAVPDASTLTDKIYRWLARGGGHVNPFTSAAETARMIEDAVGLPHRHTRELFSSLSFLNRRNAPKPIPKRLWLLGGGHEWTLFVYEWISRRLDVWFGLRTAIYGWAFFFGTIKQTVDTRAWANVCIRCGSGAPASELKLRARRSFGLLTWNCAACGATNPYFPDHFADT